MKIFLCVTNVNPIITRDFQLSIKKNQNYRSPLLSRQGVKSVKNIDIFLRVFGSDNYDIIHSMINKKQNA